MRLAKDCRILFNLISTDRLTVDWCIKGLTSPTTVESLFTYMVIGRSIYQGPRAIQFEYVLLVLYHSLPNSLLT